MKPFFFGISKVEDAAIGRENAVSNFENDATPRGFGVENNFRQLSEGVGSASSLAEVTLAGLKKRSAFAREPSNCSSAPQERV